MLVLGERAPVPYEYQSVVARAGWSESFGDRRDFTPVVGVGTSFGSDGCHEWDVLEDQQGGQAWLRWGKKWAWA